MLTGFVVVVSTVCLPLLNGSTSGVSESDDQVSNPVSVHVDRVTSLVSVRVLTELIQVIARYKHVL